MVVSSPGAEDSDLRAGANKAKNQDADFQARPLRPAPRSCRLWRSGPSGVEQILTRAYGVRDGSDDDDDDDD
jgi:hypothetical protein